MQVVEQHVSLKRAGRTLKGLCPFHSEKTPSFHVDEAKGFYHCFGCGAGGDIFRFVMQLEALTFPEAVRTLAERAGLRMPDRVLDGPGAERQRRDEELRSRVLEINQAAQELFADQLAGGGRSQAAREALAYLERRGIGAEIVRNFGLGYAPDSWDFLAKRLGQRFPAEDLLASGLLVPSDRGRAPYDRFRHRVTFPIRAVSDRVVAFGGRLLGDGEPKYLNSPETPVYTKGRHLFGLDRARAAIRGAGQAVLVEGYVDAIALHAHGIENAVAVLGTALTREQAQLLGRFTRRVVLSFDGDAAGLAAARRSLEVLLAEGLDVRVLELPQGRDPDDHVRAVGGEAYLRSVATADSFFDFLIRRATREHDRATPTGRVAALNELLPYLVAVPDRVLRSQLEDAACLGLGIPQGLLRDEVRRAVRQGQRQVEPATDGKELETLPHAESALLAWLLADGEAREAFRAMVDEDALADLPRSAIFRAVMDDGDEPFSVQAVVDRLGDDWHRRVVMHHAVAIDREPIERERLEDRIRSFVEQLGLSPRHAARRRKAEVDRELERALRIGDADTARRLMAEAHELGRAAHDG